MVKEHHDLKQHKKHHSKRAVPASFRAANKLKHEHPDWPLKKVWAEVKKSKKED